MTYPVPYVPRKRPTLPADLSRYLDDELAAIRRTLDGVLDMLPQAASEAPRSPSIGCVRRANAPWRPVPGQDDDRWVIFDGTAWAYLN